MVGRGAPPRPLPRPLPGAAAIVRVGSVSADGVGKSEELRQYIKSLGVQKHGKVKSVG